MQNPTATCETPCNLGGSKVALSTLFQNEFSLIAMAIIRKPQISRKIVYMWFQLNPYIYVACVWQVNNKIDPDGIAKDKLIYDNLHTARRGGGYGDYGGSLLFRNEDCWDYFWNLTNGSLELSIQLRSFAPGMSKCDCQ